MEIFTNELKCIGGATATTRLSGIGETPVGPPPAYGGSDQTLNPEEMFVASINSCLKLVFDHFARNRKVAIDRYESVAEGQVDKTPQGLRFTEVRVRIRVVPADPSQAGQIPKLVELAETYCLVSNSVRCPVHIELADSGQPGR